MLCLANLRLYGFDQGSDQAAMVMIVGIFFYTVGYILAYAVRSKKVYTKNTNSLLYTENRAINGNRNFNKYVVVAALIFVSVYSIFRLYLTYRLLRAGYSYTQIRAVYFNDAVLSDDVGARAGRNRLDVYLFYPLIQLLIFISCIVFFNETKVPQKKKTIFLLIAFACVGLTTFSNGGRDIIYFSVVIFLFCYELSRKGKKREGSDRRRISKKQRRLLILILAAAIIAIIVMTFRRSKTGENSLQSLMRTVYLYFTGWVPHFSIRLNDVSSTDYTYGYAFSLGLFKFFAAGLHRLLGIPTSRLYSMAEAITSNLQTRVSIGGGNRFNAFVSLFYYFYCDGGYLGVIIESFIFGLFCASVEKRYKKNPTNQNLLLYLFALYLIISSIVRWEMIHPKTAMMVYFFPLLYERKRSLNLSI